MAVRGILSSPLALLLLSAVVSLSGTGCSQAPPTAVSPRPGSLFVVGYHPYWAGDAWMSYPVEQLQQDSRTCMAGTPSGRDCRGRWPAAGSR